MRYPVLSALLDDGTASIVEPTCFTTTVKDSNWRAAMNFEFDALLKNQTWDLVPPHTAHNVISLNAIKLAWWPKDFISCLELASEKPSVL